MIALVEQLDEPSAPLARLDFSVDGWSDAKWKKALPSISVIAFWKSVVASPDEKRRTFVDDQTLLDLFERLGGDERPHRVRFRFVLMLLLVRKRLLRVQGTSSEGGIESWSVLPKGAAEGELPVSVVNPRLDDAAMMEVTNQLSEVLDGAW